MQNQFINHMTRSYISYVSKKSQFSKSKDYCVCCGTIYKACIYIGCCMMYQGMKEIHVSSSINKEKNLNEK